VAIRGPVILTNFLVLSILPTDTKTGNPTNFWQFLTHGAAEIMALPFQLSSTSKHDVVRGV